MGTDAESTVGVRALKQNASAVLRRVEAGETVTITDRGRPVARLTPIYNSVIDQLIAEGKARPPLVENVHTFEAPPPREGGPSSAEIIADVRGYDRGY